MRFPTGFKKPALGGAVFIFIGIFVGVTVLLFHTQFGPVYPEVENIQASWTLDEYSAFFASLAKEKGAEYAFEVLQNAAIPPEINIHRVAHAIGYVHFEQKGLSGVYSCTTDFRYACEHAIVVQALITLGTQALHDVAEVCSVAPGGDDAYIHCFHGVGHGLLAYLNYDYESAVGTCKTVYDIAVSLRPEVVGKRLWHECVGGVTMELMEGEHDRDAWEKARSVYMPPEDILMPCNAEFIPGEVRAICYSYLKPRFLESAGLIPGVVDAEVYARAIALCSQIPDDAFGSRDGCYSGFGAAFAYFANGDERTFRGMSEDAMVVVHDLCSHAESRNGRVVCTLSALDIIFWNGQSDPTASATYCGRALNSEIKESCFDMLFSYGAYAFPNTEEHNAFCSNFPAGYQERCTMAPPSSSYVQ